MTSSENRDASSGADNEYDSCRIADVAAIRVAGIRMCDKFQEEAHVQRLLLELVNDLHAYHNQNGTGRLKMFPERVFAWRRIGWMKNFPTNTKSIITNVIPSLCRRISLRAVLPNQLLDGTLNPLPF